MIFNIVANWIRISAIIFVTILIMQFGWNHISPKFNGPMLSIMDSIGLFFGWYLVIYCTSVAWYGGRSMYFVEYKKTEEKNARAGEI